MPKENTENRMDKLKEQVKAKKEKAEQGTSNNTSTSTSTSTDTSSYKQGYKGNDKINKSITTSSGTSSNLRDKILDLEGIRIKEYDTEDLKYASWQFTKDTLKQIKRKAEDLNVHQSQLIRFIVNKAFQDYL